MKYKEEILVKSPYLVILENYGKAIVYHSLFGHPTQINQEGLDLLNSFSTPRCISNSKAYRWIKYFSARHFLVSPKRNERANLEKTVQRYLKKLSTERLLRSLGLIITEGCNFDCTYCLSKKMLNANGDSAHKRRKMDWATAKLAIDKFIAFVNDNNAPNEVDELEIYFGGGEALLCWPLIQRIIEYCTTQYRHRQYRFKFSMNTNAALITRERGEFLSHYKVTITSSIDGLADTNDLVRRRRNGAGTFKQILAGWDNLAHCRNPIKWFCLTLTEKNFNGIDEAFFEFLQNRGIATCSFEPDLICRLIISPEEVANQLLKFRKMGQKRGIILGGLWDKPFKNLFLQNIKERMFNCSAFTGKGISVLPNGDIVPCSYSATKIGTIKQLEEVFKSDPYRQLVTGRAAGNIAECRGCEIEGFCLGGCYITTEFSELTDSQEAHVYRCQIFKAITKLLLVEAVGWTPKTTIKDGLERG